MASYVQFLNVGFGIINNTKEVETWNIKEIMEEALLMDNPDLDVRIIGFRFYDLDPVTNHVLKKSGIYYLDGEIVDSPSKDPAVISFLATANKEYPKDSIAFTLSKGGLLFLP